MSTPRRYASLTLAPTDGSPLGDIPDDELTSLVEDVLQSGKHAAAQAPKASAPDAKKSDERLHAGVISGKSSPPPGAPGAGADDDKWFFEVRGKKLGPVPLGEVSKLWAEGKIDSQSYCWHAGFSAWIPLAKVTALAKALVGKEEAKAPAPLAPSAGSLAATVPAVAAAAAPAVASAHGAGAAATVPPSPTVGPVFGGAAAPAEGAGTGAVVSASSPGLAPSVDEGVAEPAQVVTFVRASPRVVVESVVPGSLDDDYDYEVATPRPSWFKQSLLTGLVAGGVMAAIVVGAQWSTRADAPVEPARTAATPVVAPPLSPAEPATGGALETHRSPAAPAAVAATSQQGPSSPTELAPPRLAVAPPSWTAPPARTRSPAAGMSSSAARTTSTKPPAAEDEGPPEEFGPTAFAREFKEIPPDPPRRTVYIPPAPGGGAIPEQLTTAELEAVVASHRAEVRRCADAHRPLTTSKGEIVMRWTVTPDGTVNAPRAVTDGLRDSALADCLAAALRTWKFPAHQKQMEPVELPFAY